MKNILSIQSHVAYGYVGNRAAVFPLQRLGHDVWAVNTVQFSNHTGYGAWTGDVFSPEHVAAVIEGIAERGALARCDAVLSGYMGDAALGTAILDAVRRVRAGNPDAVYCCDPVMGDVGRGFFVRPGIREFMTERAVPAADVVTPNQFELEVLSGRTVATMEDALAATAAVRALGPRLVMVTSLTRNEADPETIELLLDGPDGAWLAVTPRVPLDPAPNGAGDAVAALFLAKLLDGGDPAAALAHASSAIWGVIEATRRAGTRELALIPAQNELVEPTRRFTVQKVR
ncbi:pyridoxal kinase PdxY [Arenibaculum sp.]|uniref:pyridoxal kinase PdxY n=1 Tax=Arenibaculum sp. TaxID=2865862 RepID=UPI002E13ADE5|nr:pyridoxal kinase PdxY [Arenibaculum sp.]